MYKRYFVNQLRQLKREYTEHIRNCTFYHYYRSGRTDKSEIYYKRGKIDYHDGFNSFVFEIDPTFSTYYNYKVARIIGNELLYTYLLTKINPEESPDMLLQNTDSIRDVFWTETKNALIELIYAIYAAEAV